MCSQDSNQGEVPPRLSAAQLALNRLTPSNEPLTGESGFFEQHFFVGFWHDVPTVVPPPPGQQEAPRAPQALQDLSRYKAPEACRYGQACRFKLSCSRFHGEQSVHGRNCACEEEDCLKGHPLRAGRDRQRPQTSLPDASLTPLTGGGAATGAGLAAAVPWPTQQQRPTFKRQPPPGYQCAPRRPTLRVGGQHGARIPPPWRSRTPGFTRACLFCLFCAQMHQVWFQRPLPQRVSQEYVLQVWGERAHRK